MPTTQTQLWRITYSGKEYEFNPQSLTVSQLRKIKQWFPELGTWSRFFGAFVSGDPEAFLCSVWVCRRNAGEANAQEPNQMAGDVPVWTSFDPIEAQELVEDPTVSEPVPVTAEDSTETSEPRPASTPTRRSSANSTSST